MSPLMKSARMIFIPCLLALVMLPLNAFANNPHKRPFGDVQTLAQVPDPGFPEGIAVRGNLVYVAGPASFETAGAPPSYVIAYDTRTGETVRTYTIEGEFLAAPHANSCIAFDDDGRLYVVNIQLGIVRIDLGSGEQSVYAPPVQQFNPQVPALMNDIAFDPEGNLYLTDSLQATIWRIPPGGGTPQVWFQDASLVTNFSVNGLRLSPDSKRIFFSLTSESAPGSPDFTGGRIYSLPLVDAPTAADLQLFHQYTGGAPDGIAFGRSGNLYVMLAAPGFSGVSVLSPAGAEIARIVNPPAPPPVGLITPFNSPANAAFDKHGSLLVTNHAFAIPGNVSVLSVFVDDKEAPLVKPNVP
ncbi:MAG TPA: SMP-30/gluconolactonase/LRE family protein [Pyrinomonadaceae bacterium]|nr:SMP-30/gluconolactonase/LRE family protein [Pyrinomonadaceae bacterium]